MAEEIPAPPGPRPQQSVSDQILIPASNFSIHLLSFLFGSLSRSSGSV